MDNAVTPYVTAAFFCEKVLIEKDGALSAIRIIDRVTYGLPPQGLPEGIIPIVPLAGLIAVKSGSAVGTFSLRVNSQLPSGKREENVIVSQIDLKGGDNGQNVVLNIGLGIKEDGLMWFEIMLEEQLLTKIPLMIVRSEPTQSEKS